MFFFKWVKILYSNEGDRALCGSASSNNNIIKKKKENVTNIDIFKFFHRLTSWVILLRSQIRCDAPISRSFHTTKWSFKGPREYAQDNPRLNLVGPKSSQNNSVHQKRPNPSPLSNRRNLKVQILRDVIRFVWFYLTLCKDGTK